MNYRKKAMLLVVALLGLHWGIYAQTLSLKMQNVSVKKAMTELQSKSGYSFVYIAGDIDTEKTVSVNAGQLEEAVKQILQGQNVSYEIQGKNIIIKKITQQPKSVQPKQKVTGTVKDANGEPVIGATVSEQGTSNGTVTDIDGNFMLDISADASLDISYIGYKGQTIKVDSSKPVAIVLKEDTEMLDEVVVIGYGTQKKKDLTGSVASISSEEIADRPISDLSAAFAGRIPGLDVVSTGINPGDNGSILLRGNRSFVASNDPLIILDGTTFYGSLNDINPYDIQSIDVLKDASSTAIYGSRGANGVIIITTKRGTVGTPKFTLESYVGLQTVYGDIPMMDGNQFVAWQREAARAAGQSGTDDEIDRMYLDAVEYENYKAGNSVNWQDMLYQTGIQQKHQLSVSGGSERVQYSIAANVFTQEGVLPSRKFERYTIRPNIDIELTRNLKIGLSTLLSYNKKHSDMEVSMALEDALRNSPLGSPTNEDGSPRFDPANDGYRRHPLSDLLWDSYRWEDRRYAAYVNLYAEWNILPQLKYRVNFSADANINTVKESTGENSIKGYRSGRTTAAYLTDKEQSLLSIENVLTYDQTFKNIHHITLTAIHSYQTSHAEQNYTGVHDIPYLPSRWYNIGTAATVNGYSSNLTEWKLLSFAGRAFYGLKDRYLFTVSMRADGASQFSPNHKWGYFPSAAFAWRLSEEPFMANSKNWLSNLKLRFSYGVAGNQAIEPYQTQGNLSSTSYGFDEVSGLGMRPGELANQDLKWETTSVYNLGLDFGFLDGRINGNVELYMSKTTDLLMYRQLPITTGFKQTLANVGSTKNKGIEIGLHTLNIQNRNFYWNTDFSFYLNREEIVELYNGKVDDIGNKWFIGYPISVYYGYQKIGIWQLGEEEEAARYGCEPGQIKLLDRNKDGSYTDDDRIIIGSREPKFVLNMVNSFKWRNWDLAFELYTRWGQETSCGFLNQPTSGRLNKLATLDYWTPENPTNAYPRPNEQWESYPSYGSSLTYRDGSFIRLKTLTLGYTFPKSLVERLHINNARIYLTGQNLWYWTKSEIDELNIEPEWSGDTSTYPATRTFILGLNVTF